MTIQKRAEGTELTIAVDGRIDTTTAPELEAEIAASIGEITKLSFDFAGLEYISSAGLRVLLAAQKKMKDMSRVVILNANEGVKEIFEVTGFVDILDIQS